MNIVKCVNIIFLSLTIAGCSQEPYSATKPVPPSKSHTSSHEEKKKEINLPGSCSFSIPDAFSFRERDSNYIEFYNQDGIPSIFVTTYNIKDYSPGWIALLPDTVAAAIQFRVEQEELEEEKTRGLKEYGLNSEIIRWNTPYPLPHLKQPSFGIDYVRHDKSNVMGKHQEGRAYCINIQILNGQLLYTINMKHISTPDTPVDANIPEQYSDIIQSIRIGPGDAPEQNIDPFDDAPAATSASPVRDPSWTTVSIPNICEYQIPPTMELQAGIYREIMNQLHTQVLQILDSGKRVVAQQKGLNSMDKDARSRYARVIVDFQPDSYGFAQVLRNPLIRDRDVITDIDTEMKSVITQEAAQSTAAGMPVEITSWDGTQVVSVSGIDCLKTTYSRSVKGAPAVSVSSYKIPVNNQILSVTISYRENEASIWSNDFSNIINTFNFSQK